MKPLVISERALNYLASFSVASDWFVEPIAVAEMPLLEVQEADVAVCLFTPACVSSDRMLIIRRGDDGLFSSVPDLDRRSVFDRCARIAMRAFDEAVILNPRWIPFHEGNRVSVFAYPIGGYREQRLIAEVNPLGSHDVYIFDFGDSSSFRDLGACTPDYETYRKASDAIRAAIAGRRSKSSDQIEGQFELAQIEANPITKGFSYNEWYPKQLSKDQLRFVDHPLTGPIRLKGAAGTGKTLAMALKALKVKYDADEEDIVTRILFLTHSWAMAEYVDRLIERMDIHKESPSQIDVFPLLYLASKRDYSAIGREPLGIDSEEGKKLALKEISLVVDEFVSADWIAYRSGCNDGFVGQVEALPDSRERRLFCWDLLIEFGCVIAAQGMLTHSADRERYIRFKRMRWMMPLPGPTERATVFSLWHGFMQHLKERKWISSDQIVSDYLNDLSTYYWEAARIKEGYDVIFVDEMHLFNSQERLIFHNLLADSEASPVVIMALDPTQSPRETFTLVAEGNDTRMAGIYERARLPNPKKIDLVDVFRYTPEIAVLIRSVHDVAPALDLSEDWSMPESSSSNPPGAVPSFKVLANKEEIYKEAMRLAVELSKEARKRKGRVAILCMDSERLEEYVRAASAQYQNEVIVILSRDDTERLRYAGRRFILSAPEYVAGLQFDTVIIVDANAHQVPDGQYRAYKLRRFLSELYLGLSRAEHRLVILASKDQGGLSKVLDGALGAKALVPYD
jgi:hypothetical protein